jgi:hypothetical protein
MTRKEDARMASQIAGLWRISPLDGYDLALLIGGLAIAIIGFLFLKKRTEQADNCLIRQVQKRNGRFSDDTLAFSYRDTEIKVSRSAGSRGIPAFLFATFQTNVFPTSTLRIISNNMRSVADLVMGSTYWDFLEGFSIYSNDEPFMSDLLSEEIQKDLLAYDKGLEIVFGKLGARDHFTSPLGSMGYKHSPGLFFFSVFKSATEDSDYDALIETTIMFYERLKSMPDRVIGSPQTTMNN